MGWFNLDHPIARQHQTIATDLQLVQNVTSAFGSATIYRPITDTSNICRRFDGEIHIRSNATTHAHSHSVMVPAPNQNNPY